MMKKALVIALGCLLAACASTPVRYYTLLGPASAAATVRADVDFELLPVRMPLQVDQKPLVLRIGPSQLEVLEDAQWAAPLADDFRVAMTAALSRRLGAVAPQTGPRRVAQISVDVQRFDMARSGTARLDAVWSARIGSAVTRCSASLEDQTDGKKDAALVEAQQRLLGRLADQIAGVLGKATLNPTVTCPSA